MKIILTIIRWFFGITFCLASIGGFAKGDTGLAIFILLLGLVLLPPVTQALFKSKKPAKPSLPSQTKTPSNSTATKPFSSQINQNQFPDRLEAINWHIDAINKGLKGGNLENVNLSYAKLIESIRQQNINANGNYEDALNAVQVEYEEFRTINGLEYPKQFLPPSQKQKNLIPKKENSKAEVVINPGSNFKLTLYNAPNDILLQAKKIIADENIWNKRKLLMPLFTQHNIRCREIDAYISKYKNIHIAKIEELKANSSEYQNASEMDKNDIEDEFHVIASNSLYERAACDIDLLFAGDLIDVTMDDELINQYSFETISKYIGFAHDFEKVRVDYERKEFEDLIKSGLAISGEEIPIEEILKQQTLKTLNQIAKKDDNFFKRKDKAIEYIKSDESLKNGIGDYVAIRRVFKLKSLPTKYSNINLKELSNSWAFVKEQIDLIVNTYRDSIRYTEDIKGDLSWIKGFRVEKNEDFNSESICLRAREECKKKYSKSNPPKLPFHIGCNCDLLTEM